MVFDIEKILTVGLRDWADTKRLPPAALDDYELVGVHVEVLTTNDDLIGVFAGRVPENTKIVVGYRASVSEKYAVASGTALVSKVFPEV
ncbi:MAG: hypothetical protein NTW17_03060 [Candidatus Pacearchaeota archaeon]|nr:hypothetical protein [Candidatus Pacearchaeota archaeon]